MISDIHDGTIVTIELKKSELLSLIEGNHVWAKTNDGSVIHIFSEPNDKEKSNGRSLSL